MNNKLIKIKTIKKLKVRYEQPSIKLNITLLTNKDKAKL